LFELIFRTEGQLDPPLSFLALRAAMLPRGAIQSFFYL
jgi:hypothetical protein